MRLSMEYVSTVQASRLRSECFLFLFSITGEYSREEHQPGRPSIYRVCLHCARCANHAALILHPLHRRSSLGTPWNTSRYSRHVALSVGTCKTRHCEYNFAEHNRGRPPKQGSNAEIFRLVWCNRAQSRPPISPRGELRRREGVADLQLRSYTRTGR